ncbi:hypothetical protein [Thioclava sp. GXIMD4215]|uniref:hypothetical protein n=1 Tax=Thioclava sp. GXIMD4215 TaxID=3131928 RepID=UPI00324EEB1C
MSGATMTETEAKKIREDIARLNSVTGTLIAETMRLQAQNRWYRVPVGAIAALVLIALVKFLMS